MRLGMKGEDSPSEISPLTLSIASRRVHAAPVSPFHSALSSHAKLQAALCVLVCGDARLVALLLFVVMVTP